MTAMYENTYTHYVDPEYDEPTWPKERRVLALTPIIYDNAVVEIVDGEHIARSYTRKLESPSVARIERLANRADPETNGLITSVLLVHGLQIRITRPGWVESEA